MKTLRLERLFSSSRTPAIQYSRSAEFSAVAHIGSSSSSRIFSVLPVVNAASTSEMERDSEDGSRVIGSRQCESRTSEYSARKADIR